MTKDELIKLLEPFDDDAKILIDIDETKLFIAISVYEEKDNFGKQEAIILCDN